MDRIWGKESVADEVSSNYLAICIYKTKGMYQFEHLEPLDPPCPRN